MHYKNSFREEMAFIVSHAYCEVKSFINKESFHFTISRQLSCYNIL